MPKQSSNSLNETVAESRTVVESPNETNSRTAAESGHCRFQVLDVRLTATTLDAAVSTILGWVARKERHYVNVFAVESLLKCRDDRRLTEIVNAADMVLTDGMPLVWLARRFAKRAATRCYGPDVMLRTIEKGCETDVKHFFYGGKDDALLARLEGRLAAKFPEMQVAGRFSPPHRPLTPEEEARVIGDIESSGADIVWVGIGTPKQDYWVGEFRQRLSAPALVAVGAAFDFHAGAVRQAPRWLMRCGLEWLFRLLVEPRRLWRRYIIGNPRFVWLLLRQWISGKPAKLGKIYDVF